MERSLSGTDAAIIIIPGDGKERRESHARLQPQTLVNLICLPCPASLVRVCTR